MTTNRVGHLDEAFISRIQLALPYRPLNQIQRRQIWENFLRRLATVEEAIDVASIQGHTSVLAEKDMNGRQIRNAIKTARQLAQFEGRPMDLAHLERVINVSQRFDEYMNEIEDGVQTKEGGPRELMARESYNR